MLVLAETVWVLASVYDLTAKQVGKTVTMLLDHEDLTFQDPDIIKAALDRFHLRPSLGLTDCLVFEIARKAGHKPLGTFDQHVGKADGARRLGSPRGHSPTG
ncbi:MAG: hypothetical protein JWN34_1221 [Bryobacterales bacterium]|nr:hypothetical protein [Bryobacterales bacterium]